MSDKKKPEKNPKQSKLDSDSSPDESLSTEDTIQYDKLVNEEELGACGGSNEKQGKESSLYDRFKISPTKKHTSSNKKDQKKKKSSEKNKGSSITGYFKCLVVGSSKNQESIPFVDPEFEKPQDLSDTESKQTSSVPKNKQDPLTEDSDSEIAPIYYKTPLSNQSSLQPSIGECSIQSGLFNEMSDETSSGGAYTDSTSLEIKSGILPADTPVSFAYKELDNTSQTEDSTVEDSSKVHKNPVKPKYKDASKK